MTGPELMLEDLFIKLGQALEEYGNIPILVESRGSGGLGPVSAKNVLVAQAFYGDIVLLISDAEYEIGEKRAVMRTGLRRGEEGRNKG